MGRQQAFYPLHMHVGVFAAGAVPQVHAKLKHLKAVFQHVFPEFGGVLPVGLGIGWQIVHHYYPHNAVGVKTVLRHIISSGTRYEIRGTKCEIQGVQYEV